MIANQKHGLVADFSLIIIMLRDLMPEVEPI